jgi:hypothetical protein
MVLTPLSEAASVLTSSPTCRKQRVKMSENSKNNNGFKDMTVSMTCQKTLSVRGDFIPS